MISISKQYLSAVFSGTTTMVCAGVLWPQSAFATAQPVGSINETASLIAAIAKVLGALAVVVALMMLLLYIIKKSGLTNGLAKPGSHIEIIETRMIAPKKYIAIARIADRQLAIGITDNNISLLTELEEPLVSPNIGQNKDAFAGVLQKAASYLKKKPTHLELKK